MLQRTTTRYALEWGNRLGFAKMAVDHGVTIVPVSSVGTEDMANIIYDLPLGYVPVPFLWGSDRTLPLFTPSQPQRVYFKFGAPIRTAGLLAEERRSRAAAAAAAAGGGGFSSSSSSTGIGGSGLSAEWTEEGTEVAASDDALDDPLMELGSSSMSDVAGMAYAVAEGQGAGGGGGDDSSVLADIPVDTMDAPARTVYEQVRDAARDAVEGGIQELFRHREADPMRMTVDAVQSTTSEFVQWTRRVVSVRKRQQRSRQRQRQQQQQQQQQTPPVGVSEQHQLGASL